MVMVLSGAAKKKKDLKKSSKVLNNGMSAAALESPLQLDNPMNRLSPSETTSNSSISPRGSPESPTPTSPLGIPSPLKRGSYPLTPPPSVGTPPGGPPRSYSDLMRSLAAKYNNNNTDFMSNGFVESSRSKLASLPPLFPSNPHKDAALWNRLGSFPMFDMSSTQALLSMVRSAQQHQQNLLASTDPAASAALRSPPGNPLKRGLTTPTSDSSSNPLDLSSTPPPSQKKRIAPSSDFKDLFGLRSPSVDSTDAAPKPSPKDTPLNGRSSSPNATNWCSSSPKPKPRSVSPQCLSQCVDEDFRSTRSEVESWNVNDVCDFVRGIDLCAGYVEVFREQAIDGSSLPLLTEDHLVTRMGLKLGPALKFRAVLSKKIGHCPVCTHCVHCHEGSKDAANDSRASV